MNPTNQLSSYNRRSDSPQERDVETSRQLHERDGEKERVDRAHDVGETCRMSGYVDRAAVTQSNEEREDGDAISFNVIAFWLEKHLHLSFS